MDGRGSTVEASKEQFTLLAFFDQQEAQRDKPDLTYDLICPAWRARQETDRALTVGEAESSEADRTGLIAATAQRNAAARHAGDVLRENINGFNYPAMVDPGRTLQFRRTAGSTTEEVKTLYSKDMTTLRDRLCEFFGKPFPHRKLPVLRH
ncbi:putative oxidoreductase C2F3.05c [Phytophthora cinnamomi]|uniref:putative oxidoreductase C2F3.05c n=1 Tax=Phytophthora cinnamomi TaxID=4785 RepID=UPI00355A1548|nr:putative oxidoreductase C2F3.05c [Phytophthora cinnamomi]